MLDGGPRLVWLQITLRNIGPDIVAVDEYMIPRLVFGRLGAGHFVVPFVRAMELRVYVDYNATVIEHAMMDELADREFRFRGGHEEFLMRDVG